MTHHFRLAPMTLDVLVLTLLLLLVPVAILLTMLLLSLALLVPLLLICLVYAWVWLRFRPRVFILDEEGLEVVWPSGGDGHGVEPPALLRGQRSCCDRSIWTQDNQSEPRCHLSWRILGVSSARP